MFSAIFSKGKNFCDFMFVSLVDETIQKRKTTPKGEHLLLEEQILSFMSYPHCKMRENENGVVASPESVSILLTKL